MISWRSVALYPLNGTSDKTQRRFSFRPTHTFASLMGAVRRFLTPVGSRRTKGSDEFFRERDWGPDAANSRVG